MKTDKNVVIECIELLRSFISRLEAPDLANESPEYAEGFSCAIDCIREGAESRVKYLEEVLTWYEDDPETNGTAEVCAELESLLKVTKEWLTDGISPKDTPFYKGCESAVASNMFTIVNYLNNFDGTQNVRLEHLLFLASSGSIIANHEAAGIYEERREFSRALELYNKAYSLGSTDAAAQIILLLYRGYISEDELEYEDYGIKKGKCAICGDEIYEIEYECTCNTCGWAFTFADHYLKEHEKEPFNRMSRRKAKRLLASGLTIWGKPIPDFKGN